MFELSTTYRPARPDDADPIALLHAESWRASYRRILDDDYLDGPVFDDRRDVWRSRLHDPSGTQLVVVAEQGPEIVGFACASARHDPEWGSFLDNIHVRRQLQGKGIGRGLVREVTAWCRGVASDCGLYLWVFRDNHRARRFYSGLGAVERGAERRLPVAGGSEPRDIHRYAWATLDAVRIRG